MRTILLTLVFSLACYTSLQAQTHKTYKVAPGEPVGDALLRAKAMYQYPQFSQAQVLYKNGNTGSGPMNYNRLLGEMQFINQQGDTLTMDNGKEVNFITLGTDTFYYYDGFLQLVTDFGTRIAKKPILELTNRQRIGGMGEANNGGTTSYTTVSNQHGIKDLVPNEVLTFTETTLYFIGDRFNRFKPLNRKTLHSFYAKKDNELTAYLDANPVNFQQEADVLRLIDFLKTL